MQRRPAGLHAFLNVPYDRRAADTFIAFVAGLVAHGLIPHATIEIPGGRRRLERILELVDSCQYSFHDLSRVQLDRKPPPTPRFNMPFELGLAVATHRNRSARKHEWFVFESHPRRLSKSLSDMDGTDPYIHGGTPEGVLRELNNALVRRRRQPTLKQMKDVYYALRAGARKIVRSNDSRSLFEAKVFQELLFMSRALVATHIQSDGARR